MIFFQTPTFIRHLMTACLLTFVTKLCTHSAQDIAVYILHINVSPMVSHVAFGDENRDHAKSRI